MRHLNTIAAALTMPALAAGLAATALAGEINTAEPGGAYHAAFCPPLAKKLGEARLDFTCVPSEGTRDNIGRVLADPRQIGFAQADVFALERPAGASPFAVLRTDDARECLFLVTRNKEAITFGDVAANADKLRFILPPERSGSAATFQFLKKIDAAGLGKADKVTFAPTTDDAIRQVLATDDALTLFVAFPDPSSPRFKLVSELGGHMVPVIDRTILRQAVDGQKIYYAQETQVTQATWLKSGTRVVTACTPTVVFTGAVERVNGEAARQDHRDMIQTVRALKAGDVLPAESLWKRLLRQTRELSAESTEKLIELSEEAREKAGPAWDRAKEKTREALDKAKEAYDKAKEKLEKK